mmetsp:Transcript_28054/g.89161  ORF Transcript_28054/g.89161 Transcript_28054/m.89161 type:complete len:469 (-) Transcript_28054:89-1495(-)
MQTEGEAKPKVDDEAKPKAQPARFNYRWAIGVALCLLGLAALALKQKQHRGPLQAPFVPPTLEDLGGVEEIATELPGGPESLEDALSNLEGGEAWASQGIELPRAAAEESPRPTKARKKASKPKRVQKEPEPEEPQEPGDAMKSKAKAMARDFIDTVTAPLKASASKSAVDEALENLEKPVGRKAGGKAAKKSKTSQADQEKAQAIIREALEKMRAPPSDEGEEGDDGLQERLQALVAENPEADRDPEVRKAKAIIKDAMKKMQFNKGKGKAPESKDVENDAAMDQSHMEFAERLKQETQLKPDQDIAAVRAEFKSAYGSDARQLLCSGCKLVAGRLDSELSAHDVHDAENPALMLASKRRAIDATCRSFRHIRVTNEDGNLKFQAAETAEQDEEGTALRLEQRLCSALLEDAKFDILSKLMRRKVPEGTFFHHPDVHSNNWERMLCAQRARVCKRSEVREDDDEEEL